MWVHVRRRWLFWRARCSLPALLAEMDEQRVVSIAAATNGGAAILLVALAAWLTGLPVLFPSLGPTAFILFTRPFSDAAAPRSVVLSHSTAIVGGWAAWKLVTTLTDAPLSLADPSAAVCLSAGLAFMVTAVLLVRLRCLHAPACATALIVATGAVTGYLNLLVMAGAAGALAYQGVAIHRLFGVHVPLWERDARRDAATAAPRRAA